jgi:glycosyltransferase involved in cell wall biosynthesis
VPSRDEESLAKAIREILQSKKIRQRMAIASQKRATHFSINHTVDSFIDVYESAIRARA